MQFDRPLQGGQCNGHIIQHTGLLFRGTLRCFDLFPVQRLLRRAFVAAFIAEHVGVAVDHLFADRPDNILKIEHSRVLRHLCVEHRLEQ